MIFDLFADTKLTKYIMEHLLGADLAGHLAQSGETVLQVHREQFAAESLVHTLSYPLDRLQGAA
jgi:hypothetical protein